MTKSRKSMLLVLVLAIAAFAGLHLLEYRVRYPVKADESNLEQVVRERYSSTMRAEDVPLHLYDAVQLDDRKYYLMEIGTENTLGTVELEPGQDGRYRISLSYGEGDFRDRIRWSESGDVLLLAGRDVTGRIDTITVEIDQETYTLNPAGKTHFFLKQPLGDYSGDLHLDRSKIKLYNAQGEEITAEYDLSGGDI